MKNDFDNKVTKKILDRKLFNDDNTCRTLDCRNILITISYCKVDMCIIQRNRFPMKNYNRSMWGSFKIFTEVSCQVVIDLLKV